MSLVGDTAAIGHWKRDGGWWSCWSHMLPDPESGVPWKASADETPSLHRRVTKVRPLRCKLQRVGGAWHQNVEFFEVVRELHRSNALLLAWRSAGSLESIAGELPAPRVDPSGNGLVQGHGYSILSFVDAEDASGVQLVQLRNIWGPDLSWRGSWSEGSAEWERFPEVRRHHLKPEHQAAGRFWMAWQDFCQLFDTVDACTMVNSARKASYAQRTLRGRSAGRSKSGSSFFPRLFQWECCAVERGND